MIAVVQSVVFWVLKSLSYGALFRWRKITATMLDCLIIAGAPFLLGLIPMPGVIFILAEIGVAIYLTMHYTGVELFPDGLLIPLGVEGVFLIAGWAIREFALFGP